MKPCLKRAREEFEAIRNRNMNATVHATLWAMNEVFEVEVRSFTPYEFVVIFRGSGEILFIDTEVIFAIKIWQRR